MTVKPILINVRGAIIQKDQVLLLKMSDESGMFFTFPGATVHHGESLYEALHRGISVSTGAKVDIGRLLMVWEYIPERENFRYGDRQKLTVLFLARIMPGNKPQQPLISDPNQIDVLWMPLDVLDELPLIPAIAPQLNRALESRMATGNLFIDSISPL
ncbi:MAG: NUDIX domain-containing protein [Anaerolineae bacterium]|jgi:ADP-ribose pyrophosphatase YjhB (NUDIX family)|nr:NUDIX domain-containing protein [Anaerolineae bacterium]